MFCENCGTKNNDSAKFCFHCGQPVAQPQEEVDTSENETVFLAENHIGESSPVQHENLSSASQQAEIPPYIPPRQAEIPPYVPPQPQQYINPQVNMNPAAAKKSRKGIFLVLVLVILIAAGAGGYYIYQNISPQKAPLKAISYLANGDWQSFYGIVEWNDSDYSYVEFSKDISSSSSAASTISLALSMIEVTPYSVGESYFDMDSGLMVRDVYARVSIPSISASYSDAVFKVAQTGSKFALFFDTWKVVETENLIFDDDVIDGLDDLFYDIYYNY